MRLVTHAKSVPTVLKICLCRSPACFIEKYGILFNVAANITRFFSGNTFEMTAMKFWLRNLVTLDNNNIEVMVGFPEVLRAALQKNVAVYQNKRNILVIIAMETCRIYSV